MTETTFINTEVPSGTVDYRRVQKEVLNTHYYLHGRRSDNHKKVYRSHLYFWTTEYFYFTGSHRPLKGVTASRYDNQFFCFWVL